jgi:CheY-like chemotaxis protein
MPGDADRCRDAGANDYLAKPVKLKQLAAAVERHLAAFAY